MGRKPKNKIGVWDIIVWILLILAGYALYHTNILRAQAGYFDDGPLIFWNSASYIIFFALVTGYVISKLISRTNNH